MTQKRMAAELGVSAAYLSSLEHGKRGRPTPGLVRQITAQLALTWDEAEELIRLAELSHPRITVDTAGLNPRSTELANLLAESIHELDEATIEWIIAEIRGALGRGKRDRGPAY